MKVILERSFMYGHVFTHKWSNNLEAKAFRRARNITNWIKKNPKNHPSENDEGLFTVKAAGITLLIVGVILVYSQFIQFIRQLF
jgi:hypothetical protein